MGGRLDRRWERVDALFQDALARAPEERSAFLDEACGDDPELRRAVDELLKLEAESRDALSTPVGELLSLPWEDIVADAAGELTALGAGEEESDRSGERVGSYRLIRRLGRGGMATVYLAERADGLWEQKVALKLVRRGLDTDDVVRRFLAERQILSSLSHPNIASLLDGGTTGRGLPYLVMEYVEGTPITKYCDERTLSVEGRLRLFAAVGRAVEHAHRRLVVHRDLKPSNILVTDEGRVKLLDFGIAKILDPAEDVGALTRTGILPLTPEYASPEQVAGEPITTASDVYQLGIILCELLSGRRPYDVGRLLSSAGLRAFLERVEPTPPSQLVTPAAARRRSLEPDHAPRRLRGDLDNIVIRATEGEPERRYASVAAMVADVERHEAGLPVEARPATLAYRTRKLFRRRPWLGPAVAAALVVLGGYVFTLARHSRELERERNVARQEAERAEEVQSFLVDLFRSADPYATDRETDRDITVREALEVGVDRMRAELKDRPALRATLLEAIGDVYANVDRLDAAREVREEALALNRTVHGPESLEVAQDLRKLGRLAALQGGLDSADVLLGRSLELTRRILGSGDTAVAGVMVDLADLEGRRGHMDRAESHLIDAVELLRSLHPLPVASLAAAYTALLDVYPSQGRMVEAHAAAEEAVRLTRLAYGPEHPRTAVAMVEAADLHDWEGHGDEAVPVYRRAIAILDATLGPDHQRTLEARNNLAVTLRHLGELEEAEAVHRRIVNTWKSKPGGRPTDVADALQNLAVVLRARGKLAEAEQHLMEARDLYDAAPREGNYRRAFPRLTLASVRLDRGEYVQAERVAREAVAILEVSLPPTSYVTATGRCRIARAMMGQGHVADARPILEEAVDVLDTGTQPSVRYRLECRRALQDLYDALGQDDLAEAQGKAIRALSGGAP